MSVTAIGRLVQAWSELVWPANREQRTAAVVERLTRELAERYRRLVGRRRRVEQIRDRLARHQRAGHLDAVARSRRRLQEQEEKYARQRRAFLRLKALRGEVLRGQVVVCAEPRGDEE